jgi:hypothetical protein
MKSLFSLFLYLSFCEAVIVLNITQPDIAIPTAYPRQRIVVSILFEGDIEEGFNGQPALMAEAIDEPEEAEVIFNRTEWRIMASLFIFTVLAGVIAASVKLMGH